MGFLKGLLGLGPNTADLKAILDRRCSHMQQGEFDKAIADFTKVIDCDPKYYFEVENSRERAGPDSRQPGWPRQRLQATEHLVLARGDQGPNHRPRTADCVFASTSSSSLAKAEAIKAGAGPKELLGSDTTIAEPLVPPGASSAPFAKEGNNKQELLKSAREMEEPARSGHIRLLAHTHT